MSAGEMGVYAIRDREADKVYVGSTVNFRVRFSRHRCDLALNHHRNAHLQRARNKRGADSFDFVVLQAVTDPALLAICEQEWIERLRAYDREFGYNLIRLAEHRTHSPETIERMRTAHRGKRFSAEHRAKIGAAHKGRAGRRWTTEERQQISERQRGRKPSPESRAKFVATMKGRPGKPLSPETRQKLSMARKGRPKSPEHRAKIGAAQKGKKLSPEHRAMLAQLQRNRSPETRAKLSESNGKLTNEQVVDIRTRRAAGTKIADLAEEYGLHRTSVSEIVRRLVYKHLP